MKAYVPDENLYPAILELFGQPPNGKILDAPSGQGAFALELVKRGYNNIYCSDINSDDFRLDAVKFVQHDAQNPLPFPDNYFDYIFSVEGLEHFEAPFFFVKELCRVLKTSGRVYITTPNTFSVDARIKYLLSGYFPRFKALMYNPYKVMEQSVDQAHISPIYFWQLNFFLSQAGVKITRISTNNLLYKPQWYKRIIENLIASLIRNNIKKRNFPDKGASSGAVLFGDCLIVEGIKQGYI
ncbi:MAG: methyltransferase domain-containing protein [Nitrospirae bacterium]|nr:methyltransferase domain-containing protein [Nitrospirota bacterium]MCL5977093.1 methyltransferase domain-containing protein [Nitrospirota bacterium]